MILRSYFLVSLMGALGSSLLPVCDGAGFFIQGASLTWHPPRKYSRKTCSLNKDGSRNVYKVFSDATVVDPQSGQTCQALDDTLIGPGTFRLPFARRDRKALVVVMPQLGDFDSCEYAELLTKILPDLESANIALRVIGIGNCKSAHMFSLFTGLPLDCIRVDPRAEIHSSLLLHRGPNWEIPDWIPQEALDWFAHGFCGSSVDIGAKEVARAWLNYMAMCAGIAAPGTLQEILRGYVGDKSAPERLLSYEKVRAGPITIKGVSDVKIGPIQYKSAWQNEKGYLRPAELATVRLRSMVEVLTKFGDYVPDQRYLDWRGGTFLIDESTKGLAKPLYEWRDTGVLTYSETMDRPLSFLSNDIGMERARNPMGMNDPEFVYE